MNAGEVMETGRRGWGVVAVRVVGRTDRGEEGRRSGGSVESTR